MPTKSSSQIDPPEYWEEFEDICRDLWEKIWNDPNTQKNGRQGQPQNGVDIFGRPNQGNKWAGVQCKKKDKLASNSLTEKELIEEIEKAKSFNPKISEFIIALTGQRDGKIQRLARQITEKHLKEGLFSVNVWSWRDIKNKLAEFDELIDKHYPHLSKKDKILENGIKDLKDALKSQYSGINSSINSIDEKLDIINNSSDVEGMIVKGGNYKNHQDERKIEVDLWIDNERKPLVTICAYNPGYYSVSLIKFKYMVNNMLVDIIEGMHESDRSKYDGASAYYVGFDKMIDFPHVLKEGEAIFITQNARNLATTLYYKDFSGKIKLSACFETAQKKKYKSKSLVYLDIEKYRNIDESRALKSKLK